jgi:asparagine synthase (glutamine-hydrolysing)
MCGLVGFFAREGDAPHRPRWPELVNHLRHRGPDAGSFWADGPFFLGHRRLSILGLASGHQPMATADGQLVVILNGEIYNFVELRAELQALGHAFRTDSDTEVLLHGYRAWGEELPRRLVGQFAFAVADRRLRRLFLVRDRFGEKPLFVLRTPRYVAFASELRPLAALPDLERRLDVAALGGYLSLNYVPGDQTLMAGVRRLPPATQTMFTIEGERSQRTGSRRPRPRGSGTWRPPSKSGARARPIRSPGVRADVPVGIFLSGMDSALVTESPSAREFEPRLLPRLRRSSGAARGRADGGAASGPSARMHHLDQRRPATSSRSSRTPTIARRLVVAGRVDDRAFGRGRNKVVLGGDGGDELWRLPDLPGQPDPAEWTSRFTPPCARPGRVGRAAGGTQGVLSERARRFLRAADLPPALARHLERHVASGRGGGNDPAGSRA